MTIDPGSVFSRSAPFLFGHRGYSHLAPENTLPAFQALLDQHIPGVELDVQRCRSGEVIVLHDSDVQRICGKPGRVEDLSLEELRRLDAGVWFGPRFAGTRIPLLSEVFSLLTDRVYYDIELKGGGITGGLLESLVLTLISQYRLQNRCMISSFNPFSIRRFEKLDSGIPTAVIYSHHRGVPVVFRHGQGGLLCRSPIIKPYHVQIGRWSSAWKRRVVGRRIFSWTVDEPHEAERLLGLGVTGICSNDPGKIKKQLGLQRTFA